MKQSYRTIDQYTHAPLAEGWHQNTGHPIKADVYPVIDVFYGNNTTQPSFAYGVKPSHVTWDLESAGPAVSHWRPVEGFVRSESALDVQHGGSHYKDMAVQPWEAMEAWLTEEEYRGYHKGVAIAYLARERQKGGLEDIEKAIHHLQRLVEVSKETGEK